MSIENVLKKLSREVSGIDFSTPVHTVYNPLDYAYEAHLEFWRKFGTGKKEALLLGMNPGPWGMAQTGVPFGEIPAVRDWMGLDVEVRRPFNEHPKRPVTGLECTRSEVSGKRLWGWAASRFGAPENFFSRFFVINYCPLMFMEESGRNRTPDKLKREEREALYAPCDQSIREYVSYLEPEVVIGVGKFAMERAIVALEGSTTRVERITHPSPANPAANRGWEPLIERELEEMGIAI